MGSDESCGNIRDLALLYACDILPIEERREVERRLEEGDLALRAELLRLEETLGQLGAALPLATPPPDLKQRLMARIQPTPRGLTEHAQGIHVLRDGQGQWAATPFDGVTVALLHVDPVTALATQYIRMEPGAVYPSHRHTAAEHCFVLEGDLRIGDLVLQAGDYERADADTQHGTVTTEQGCLLLIIASQRDELLG